MESISSLKKKYASLNKEWNNLLSAVHFDPKVIETFKAYEKAKEVYREGINGQLEVISKEQKEINLKIDELEKKKDKTIPKEVNDFIGNLCAGVERSAYTIKWVSPSKRFIIATEAGHMYWSCRGTQSYAQSYHSLFDLTQTGNAKHGCDFERNCKVFFCKGRLTKDTMEKWKEHAMKEEAK